MDRIGEELLSVQPGLIQLLEENESLPDEMRELIKMAKEGKGEATAILGSLFAGTAVSGAMSASLFPAMEGIKQTISAKQPFQPVPIINLIILMFRKMIEPEFFFKEMARYGINEYVAKLMLDSYQYYPVPQDLINWIAKEVFEPNTVKEFGLEEETPMDQVELFNKAGVTGEQLRNFWIAHWQHPSYRDVVELYRRDQITEENFWKWFKLVEIPPIWRNGLIHTSWDTPNRIETRMMCRYLDLDKEYVMKLLQYAGLAEEFRSDAADFMIIMGVEGDIRKRYSKGWISADEVKSEITKRGVGAQMAGRVYQRIVSEEKETRLETERDLSKSEIVKGVKNGIIDWGKGLELLKKMGYDDWESDFILEVNLGAQTGSPESPADFEMWAELYGAASGKPTERSKEEILNARQKMIEAKKKERIMDSEEKKIQVDTIRRRRRKGLMSREQEITALRSLHLAPEYAETLADNDDIRLAEKAAQD